MNFNLSSDIGYQEKPPISEYIFLQEKKNCVWMWNLFELRNRWNDTPLRDAK